MPFRKSSASTMSKCGFRVWLAWFLALPAVVLAHESRPLYLQITELSAQPGSGHQYMFRMHVPPSVESGNRPAPILPESCRGQHQGPLTHVECRQSLAGQTIGIAFPRFNPAITTLIRISFANGESHQKLLPPSESRWKIPDRQTASAVAGEFARLGVAHILQGWDHLLFLLCLLMLAGTLKRSLITVSGFTLAHSLTLALTTLGIVHLPSPPVEAAIALSILFLAAEISRERRNTLAWRWPVLVSILFGLIHGSGFAAALREAGLPQSETGTALLFFNVGVEIGQVLFVGATMGLFQLLRRWPAFPLAQAQRAMIYGVGSLAAFWTLQRIAGF